MDHRKKALLLGDYTHPDWHPLQDVDAEISRIFHQATGSSLWEYVTIKRLLAARAMIQRGEPAGTACLACGFSDYSAFFRAYRSHFGHVPRQDAVQN